MSCNQLQGSMTICTQQISVNRRGLTVRRLRHGCPRGRWQDPCCLPRHKWHIAPSSLLLLSAYCYAHLTLAAGISNAAALAAFKQISCRRHGQGHANFPFSLKGKRHFPCTSHRQHNTSTHLAKSTGQKARTSLCGAMLCSEPARMCALWVVELSLYLDTSVSFCLCSGRDPAWLGHTMSLRTTCLI